MTHPGDGTLRRLLDEPACVRDVDKRHVDACTRCQSVLKAMRADAAAVAIFMTGDVPRLDAGAALADLHARLGRGQVPMRPRWTDRLPGAASWKIAGGGLGAAAVLAAASVLPAGRWTQQLINVFQPDHVQVVPVTSAQLQDLPDLRSFGTVYVSRRAQPQTYTSRSAASRVAGLSLIAPAGLPADVSGSPSYRVTSGTTASFTFSARTAAAAVAAHGRHLPTMPPGVDGSTLRVTVHPAAVTLYGRSGDIPSLIIGEMRAPRIVSIGSTVSQLENYVLSLPGVPVGLAQELRAMNDPTRVLPLVIPVDRAQAHAVTVQGVNGLAVGDNTGLGSGVVWEKDGVMYGVAGPLPESEVLSIAGGLR